MAFIAPEQCTWKKACEQNSNIPDFTIADLLNASNYTHTIDTNINITLCNETIPVINTKRTWQSSFQELNSLPGGEVLYDGSTYVWCSESRGSSFTSAAKEDCTITRSTLYYIDHRRNVCLYRTNKEHIEFDIHSNLIAPFKHPFGMVNTGKLIIKTTDYKCSGVETFYLIVDGIKRTLCTANYMPIPTLTHMSSDGSDILFDSSYTPDPNVELIITVPTVSSSDYIPWDDQLRYHGFYSYRGSLTDNQTIGLDGGFRDYYYPQWCRELQNDPVWERAAESRYYLNKEPTQGSFTQNISSVLPDEYGYPTGNHAYHADFGDVYQWLIEQRDGAKQIVSSHEFNDLIKSNLPEGLRNVSGSCLYYPIGVL